MPFARRLLIVPALLGAALLCPPGVKAADGPKVTPIASTATTWSGQPYAVPQGPIEVRAFEVEIAAGGRLPPHKHPYPRFAYVRSGVLSVTNEATGVTRKFGPGEFVVEAIDQWHQAEVLGPDPVKILVIDQAPPGASNVVPKP